MSRDTFNSLSQKKPQNCTNFCGFWCGTWASAFTPTQLGLERRQTRRRGPARHKLPRFPVSTFPFEADVGGHQAHFHLLSGRLGGAYEETMLSPDESEICLVRKFTIRNLL